MFNNSTGLQFNGARFYTVAGDVNMQINTLDGAGHPDTTRDYHPEGLRAIQDGNSLGEGPSSGNIRRMDRRERRFAPYDTLARPHLQDMVHIATKNVNHIYQGTGLDTLHRHAATEAMYDSAESFPQPRCHPETRIKLLGNLLRRLDDPDARVLWLHGPAGSGKSAVMQTLCQRLQDAGRLGGSYFFKRGHPNRSNGRVLFATLAYQLAIFEPSLKSSISRRVEANPALISTSIAAQLRELVVEPSREASGCGSRILLIDGLDECDGIPVQQEILRSIGDIFCVHHTLPIKVIIASRPEPDIREILGTPSFKVLTMINVEQSFADVRIFLRGEFARIYQEHHSTMSSIHLPWPSDAVLSHLVDKSSGYFIYAATVIKFVDDKYFRPTEQLEIIMNTNSHASDVSPFESLDQLYRQILSQVLIRHRPRLLNILYLLFLPDLSKPYCPTLSHLTISHIAQLLHLDAGDIRLTLRGLHSVLDIADANSDSIAPRHASFRDFLISKERSLDFFIYTPSHRLDSARLMLRALSCKSLPDDYHIAWLPRYGLTTSHRLSRALISFP
ncbi:hypothetical protein FB45DRAFT_216791 [Roridomyces roridus]|uniref:AAA+ ATPase domain-containing protein n=1 Tax=Roridomyces roridus TaxID=1738132 RepID=A0AAD7BDV8_9AGAR|nr:hypothetical protein FB45DRAFT_216791 [Roridomyces roridus]